MAELSAQIQSLQAAIYTKQGDVEGLLAILTELEGYVSTDSDRNLFDAIAYAYYQLSLATADQPSQAEVIIAERFLPWLISPASEASSGAGAHGRATLRDWIDQYHEPDRARLIMHLLSELHRAVLVASESSEIEAQCWTLSALGYRRADIVERLWTIVQERDDETGDIALKTIAALGVSNGEKERLLQHVHSRLERRFSVELLRTLEILADPSSVGPLISALERGGIEEFSLAHPLGVQALIHVAAENSTNVQVQHATWQAVLSLCRRFPERYAGMLYLGEAIAPHCDVHDTVPGLLGFIADHPGKDENAVHQRRLIYLRVNECIRPRQLEGAAGDVPTRVLRIAHQDARNDSKHDGRFGTIASQTKESAWAMLLHRGDPVVLSREFFSKAVAEEAGVYLRGDLLEALSAFRWTPLPPQVVDWITRPFDATQETISRELSVRKGAILLARSAATREAFDALLHSGFTFRGAVLRDSAMALSSVAARLARSREPGIVDALLDSTGPETVERQVSMALSALVALAGADLLDAHALSQMVDLANDNGRDMQTRARAIDVLAATSRERLPTEGRTLLVYHANEESELTRAAVEALAETGLLLDMPEIITRHLPLRQISKALEKWELTQQKPGEWAIRFIGALYAHAPDRFANPVASLLETATIFDISPLLWAVEVAHKQRASTVPDEISNVILSRLIGKSSGSMEVAEQLLQMLAYVSPERLGQQEWHEVYMEWPWQARRELAESLGRGVTTLTTAETFAEAINQAILLTRESQYAIRRAAYRALLSLSSTCLLLSQVSWATSSSVSLRRRAAEICAWIPSQLPDDMLLHHLHIPVIPGWQDRLGRIADQVRDTLAADPDPLVREALESAIGERRRQEWLSSYFTEVVALCDKKATSNREALAGWRYGHALVALGDEQTVAGLDQLLSREGLAAHSIQWLRSVRHDLAEALKKRSDEWPKPWFSWPGHLHVGAAVVSQDGEMTTGLVALTADIQSESHSDGLPEVFFGMFLPFTPRETRGEQVSVTLADGRHGTATVSQIPGGLWSLSRVELQSEH